MKLLLDQNISPKLVSSLKPVYPETSHVSDAGLDRAQDEEIWSFAVEYDFTILTKDSDLPSEPFCAVLLRK